MTTRRILIITSFSTSLACIASCTTASPPSQHPSNASRLPAKHPLNREPTASKAIDPEAKPSASSHLAAPSKGNEGTTATTETSEGAHEGAQTPAHPPADKETALELRGALRKDVIRRVVTSHREHAKACYEAQLASKPDLSGLVTIVFVIDPQGKVMSARVISSTLGDEDVHQCIVEMVKSMQFPEPAGGGIITVNYPYKFSVDERSNH